MDERFEVTISPSGLRRTRNWSGDSTNLNLIPQEVKDFLAKLQALEQEKEQEGQRLWRVELALKQGRSEYYGSGSLHRMGEEAEILSPEIADWLDSHDVSLYLETQLPTQVHILHLWARTVKDAYDRAVTVMSGSDHDVLNVALAKEGKK